MIVLINIILILLIVLILWYKYYNATHINSISFKESLDLTNLPIITFYVGKSKYNFLLDTGASLSVINKDIINVIEHSKSKETSTIYGMEGNTVEAECVDICLYYNEHKFEDLFQVVDLSGAFANMKMKYGVTLHGILSSSFFQKYKYVLDFDKLIAYSKLK